MSEQDKGAEGGKKMVITCESNLDISVAGEFHELLKKALNEQQQVEIDASQVERVDGIILQLMYSYWKAASAAGLAFSIKSASDAFNSSARLLGMGKALNLL